MKVLFKLAIKNRKHLFLIVLAVLTMFSLTIASQLEIFTLGVLTKKGPDFFVLFGSVENGKLEPANQVSREVLEERWQVLDAENKGYVTHGDTTAFLTRRHGLGFIERATYFLDQWIPVSGSLNALAVMLVVVALFKAVTIFCHRFTTSLVAIRISRDLRQAYFEHLQSLPMEFYQKYHVGSLSARVVGDAGVIADSVKSVLTNYLQVPFNVVTTLLLCFLTSWQLSLVIFLGLPVVLFPIAYIARRIKRVSRQIQKNQESFTAVLIDFLAGIQTIKVFAMEEFSLKKYRDQNNLMSALEQKSARYDVSSRPVIHTVGMFFLATALFCGLYVFRLSVANVLFFSGLIYVLYEPLKKFAEENSDIQRGVAAAERMLEVMALRPQIEDSVDAVDLGTLRTTIEFDDVWFRYADEWVLKGVSFTIQKGERVAIVGPTGSGKSTIVQLLPRLYEVQKGEIRVNGKPLNHYTQKSLRENIAFVPQKPFLFLDTIAANIAFGRSFSEDEICAAATKAHAVEFIEKLPLGYQTQLAEAGKNFSGGQQQRLAIARALVKKAPILVMDEATSSLDAVSESHIKTALRGLAGNVTQVLIAHRLSTIEDADKIIYIDHGEKVAEGTKDELIERCEGFRLMWNVLHAPKASHGEQKALT